MSIESLIFVALFVNGSNGSLKPPKNTVMPGDTKQEDKEEKKQKQAEGAVRAAKGAMTANKLAKGKIAKKLGVGGKGRAAMIGAGAAGGALIGRGKAKDREEENQEEGKVKERGRINRTGRAAAREGAKEAGKYALRTALTAIAGPVGRIAAEALIHHKAVLRVGLVLIAILVVFFYMIFDETTFDNQEGKNPLQIQKQGPTSAKKGDTLPYIITVSYPGSATNAVVTDQLPDGTSFVCSTVGENPCTGGNSLGTYDKTSNTVTWDAKQLSIPLTNPINFALFVMLKATKDNSNVINYAQVTLTGGSLSTSQGGSTSGNGYVAPNTDNCKGKYASQIASNYLLHKNFGDPQCNFNKDQAYTALKQQDPQDASTFFTIIVPCESSWNANTWAPPSTGTPNSQGAWGLFQMGDSRPAGQPANANSIDDRGDVNWQLQIVSATKKAIQEHHVLNSAQGGYWSSDDWKRC